MEPISSFPSADPAGDWVKCFYEQASRWWGAEPHQIRMDRARAATIEHFCGPGPKRILELGAGTWQTASALADLGHTVLAVEFSPLRDGLALIDVFNPSKAARDAGSEERLDPLPGVPESVEMFRRCHFDPLACLWIDHWVPTAAPDKARAQTLRCYSPADFALLLEGTGLALEGIDLNGTLLSLSPLGISGIDQKPGHPTESTDPQSAGDLLDAWSYLALLRKA